MKRVRLICRSCGHKFVAEVIEPEEVRERQVPTKPVRCEKCGSTSVERT